MAKNKLPASLLLTVIVLALVGGCSRRDALNVPELSDQPVLQQVVFKDLTEKIPAYGISTKDHGRLQFEVNIEADDSSQLSVGERAVAYPIPNKVSIPCLVSRVMPSVSAETGQSIAWLDPIEISSAIPRGEFIYATILTGIRRHVLTIPRQAILVSHGQTMVVREQKDVSGKSAYVPTPVTVGLVANDEAEIKSGLTSKDQVVVQGGIGFSYPAFKANLGAD